VPSIVCTAYDAHGNSRNVCRPPEAGWSPQLILIPQVLQQVAELRRLGWQQAHQQRKQPHIPA